MQQMTIDTPEKGFRDILEEFKKSGRTMRISVITTSQYGTSPCIVKRVFTDCVEVHFTESYSSSLDSTCIIPFRMILCISS